MKHDVESRDDLERILREFYTRLISNRRLHPYFDKFREEHVLEHHLKDLTDFWEGALFYKGNYKKNVMEIHKKIDNENKLKSEHFEAWLMNFEQAVDKFYEGQNAEKMKIRARSIATVMEIKFHDTEK